MNKYKITWSPIAYNDLENIYFYIKYYLKEKNIANSLTKKILKSIQNLNYLPEKYVKFQNFNDKIRNIRKMPVDNYVVIYEVDNINRTSFNFTYFSCKSRLFKQIIKVIYTFLDIIIKYFFIIISYHTFKLYFFQNTSFKSFIVNLFM